MRPFCSDTRRNLSPSSGQSEFQSPLSLPNTMPGGVDSPRIVVNRPSAISRFGTAATRATDVADGTPGSGVSCQDNQM